MTITTLKKSYLIMIIKATVMFSSLKKMERKKVSFRLNQFYFRDFTPLSNEIYGEVQVDYLGKMHLISR